MHAAVEGAMTWIAVTVLTFGLCAFLVALGLLTLLWVHRH
jgi:hypothetical protein